MPIYEYRCTSCGHELEQMQKVSDPAPEKCPACGQPQTLERLVSRSSFHLKGGGWYSDLYSSTKKDGGAGTSSPAASSAPASAPAAAPTSAPASTGGASGSGGSSTGSGSGGTT